MIKIKIYLFYYWFSKRLSLWESYSNSNNASAFEKKREKNVKQHNSFCGIATHVFHIIVCLTEWSQLGIKTWVPAILKNQNILTEYIGFTFYLFYCLQKSYQKPKIRHLHKIKQDYQPSINYRLTGT